MNEEEYFSLFKKRKNAKKAMDAVAARKLVQTLREEYYLYLDEEDTEASRALVAKLRNLGVTGEKQVQFFQKGALKRLDQLISFGFDPKVAPKAAVYDAFLIGEIDREYDVFAKSTFDALVSHGFCLDAADLIVLDEKVEPALKGLPSFYC